MRTIHTFWAYVVLLLLFELCACFNFSDNGPRDTDIKMLMCSTIFSYVDIIMHTVEVITCEVLIVREAELVVEVLRTFFGRLLSAN